MVHRRTFQLCLQLPRVSAAHHAPSPCSVPSRAMRLLQLRQSDGDEVRSAVVVCDDEEHELSGSKGTAHFVFSWPETKRQSSLDVVQIKKVTQPAYTADDSGKYVAVVAFDCRGCVPVAYHPRDEWTVVSSGGSRFEDVDLSEKEWADVCEKSNDPVTVMELDWRFEHHKEK